MQEMVTVALDAMGGDNAPQAVVQGALDALREGDNIRILLVGRPEAVKPLLEGAAYSEDRLFLIPAAQEISNEESPVNAIRTKKDSSMVVGLNLVKDGKADAFVSAGSTGALLAGGQLIVKRIRGVERAPLAPLIPTAKGASLLIDCGANVDARPSHLVQFAQMGSIYMEHVMGVPNPRVALVNIGAEAEKGNALVKETYPLLEACPGIHFVGNIEARDIPKGQADVVVCEAFVGNVILKFFEGVGSVFLSTVKQALKKNLRSKIGAFFALPSLKESLKTFDASQYGGAPMLGLQGLVVKTHGSADAKEVKNTILQCAQFKEQAIMQKIQENLGSQPKND